MDLHEYSATPLLHSIIELLTTEISQVSTGRVAMLVLFNGTKWRGKRTIVVLMDGRRKWPPCGPRLASSTTDRLCRIRSRFTIDVSNDRSYIYLLLSDSMAFRLVFCLPRLFHREMALAVSSLRKMRCLNKSRRVCQTTITIRAI